MLLWGIALLRLGVTRGFGAALRRTLSRYSKNPLKGALAGIGITAVLQSSTATTMIVSAFAGRKFFSLTAALSVVLGADIGTTLVAQFLSLDLNVVMPLALIGGFILYMWERSGRVKNVGRILVGLSLMLLALEMIGQAAAPLKDSATLPLILQPLRSDPLLAVVLAALMTWLMHSSLAFVLVLVPLATGGVLPLDLALYLVLGANLGGTVAPLLATVKDAPEATRVPMGNLLIKIVGVGACCALLPVIAPLLAELDAAPARQIVNLHTFFNLALAIVFLPLLPVVGRICKKLVPDRPRSEIPGAPRYLDERAMDTPSIALASATRETLRMADLVQQMLQETIVVFRDNDLRLLKKIREQDDAIDSIYAAIKTYMAKLTQEFMDPGEADRYLQILTFSTNLEHVGDVIDKNLMPLAEKKIRNQYSFSSQGLKEIEHMHNLVLESVRLAQSLFVSDDIEMARRLLQDKDLIRQAEREGMSAHIERLGEGVPETVATSSLHLDVIRDYRRINTYMCTVAYPYLEQSGQLRAPRFSSGAPQQKGKEKEKSNDDK